jgi:hypothetical protein
VVVPDLVHDVVEAAVSQSVPCSRWSGVEEALHLPGETGGEDGREHQVVGGEKAPADSIRISLEIRYVVVVLAVTCL